MIKAANPDRRTRVIKMHKAIPFGIAICGALWAVSAAADPANPLTGSWYGTATITAPAEMGVVDLAFHLDVDGSEVDRDKSHVDLDKTLLFPVVAPQVDGQDVGPRVGGTLSATAFSLTSDDFPATVAERAVTRRIQLDGTEIGSGGTAVSGTYTETVTGLTKDPVVMTGPFMLAKPTAMRADGVDDRDGDGCVTLDEIRAGGLNPTVIELGDISTALAIYNGASPSLRIGRLPDCTEAAAEMQQALAEYYGTRQ